MKYIFVGLILIIIIVCFLLYREINKLKTNDALLEDQVQSFMQLFKILFDITPEMLNDTEFMNELSDRLSSEEKNSKGDKIILDTYKSIKKH